MCQQRKCLHVSATLMVQSQWPQVIDCHTLRSRWFKFLFTVRACTRSCSASKSNPLLFTISASNVALCLIAAAKCTQEELEALVEDIFNEVSPLLSARALKTAADPNASSPFQDRFRDCTPAA